MNKTINRQLDLEAADWLITLDDEAVTAAQMMEWQQWMAAPTHRRAFEQAQRAYLLAAEVEDAPWPTDKETAADEQDVLVPASRFMNRPVTRRWVLAASVGVAAAGAGLLGMHLSGGVEVLTTGLGESRLVVLKDGSRITLGAASRLRVRINQDRRTLSLEKGEALFNVQADAARPFVVNSGGAEVIAVGTAFNVRHTLGRVNVAVTEGNVKVNSLPLAVGQQIWVMDGKLSLPSPVDITAILGRTAGRLEYNAEPLKYVAADLTRYSTVPVEVLDPAANEVLVTGTVMQTDLRGWLDGLQEALPVTVTFTSRAVTVRSR